MYRELNPEMHLLSLHWNHGCDAVPLLATTASFSSITAALPNCSRKVQSQQARRCEHTDAALLECAVAHKLRTPRRHRWVHIQPHSTANVRFPPVATGSRHDPPAPQQFGSQFDLQQRMFGDLVAQPFFGDLSVALVLRLDVHLFAPSEVGAALGRIAERQPRKMIVAFRTGSHCDWCCSWAGCTDTPAVPRSNDCHESPERSGKTPLPRVADVLHWVPVKYLPLVSTAKGSLLSESLNHVLSRSRLRQSLLRKGGDAPTTKQALREWGYLEYLSNEYADSNPMLCANSLYALAGRATSVSHSAPMCELLPPRLGSSAKHSDGR